MHLERVTGIEPAFSAWEADVLPLNYTRSAGETTGVSRAAATAKIQAVTVKAACIPLR